MIATELVVEWTSNMSLLGRSVGNEGLAEQSHGETY